MIIKSSFFLAALLQALQARGAEPVVKLASIQAVFEEGRNGLGDYNSGKGLGVTLLITSDKPISGWENDKMSLKIGGVTDWREGFSSFSGDHKSLRFEIFTAGSYELDANGAVKVTGEVPITVSSGTEETKSTAFKVAAGTKIVFPAAVSGMPELVVKSAGKSQFDPTSFEVVLTTNRKSTEFAGIRFLDLDEKEIEATQAGSSWMGSNGRGSGEIIFEFKAAPGDLVLALSSYKGTESVDVKVDLSASLAPQKP